MYSSRRKFLKASAIAAFSFAIPKAAFAFTRSLKKKVSLGVISDLHYDLIPDGKERLNDFLSDVMKRKPDAIIQMGDFAFPSEKNQDLVNLFNHAHPQSFHVLGNHDMDEGFTKEDCRKSWGIPSSYYTKEVSGLKLIVLDGNDAGSPTHKGGYASYIGKEQQDWLKAELEAAVLPVVVISHQPIAGVYPIDNTVEIQRILSTFSQKIIFAINGHAHVTQHLEVSGVNYVHINSASYYWVGAKFKHKSYTDAVHENYTSLEFACPYESSLFAFLTIDPVSMRVTVKGKKTKWIGPNPAELGYDIVTPEDLKNHVKPEIESWRLEVRKLDVGTSLR